MAILSTKKKKRTTIPNHASNVARNILEHVFEKVPVFFDKNSNLFHRKTAASTFSPANPIHHASSSPKSKKREKEKPRETIAPHEQHRTTTAFTAPKRLSSERSKSLSLPPSTPTLLKRKGRDASGRQTRRKLHRQRTRFTKCTFGAAAASAAVQNNGMYKKRAESGARKAAYAASSSGKIRVKEGRKMEGERERERERERSSGFNYF